MTVGDYTELSVMRESMPDGQGGEVDGLAIRVWGEAESWAADRGQDLLVTVLYPSRPDGKGGVPNVRDLVDAVLACWELEPS